MADNPKTTPDIQHIYETSEEGLRGIKEDVHDNRPDRDYHFIDELVENYNKETQLDFMYHFNDYFSDKYKIRKKIADEQAKVITIKEINQILNKLVFELKLQYGHDVIKSPKYSYMNKDFNNYDFNVMACIENEYGKFQPEFYESDDLVNKAKSANRILFNDLKEKIENEERDPPALTENDVYEIESFKAFKNDTMYKHYLMNHLAYFSEKINDMNSSLPYAMRGIVYNFNTETSRLYQV